jgi:pimeloyl-ACP methyl ester carboxylesterase
MADIAARVIPAMRGSRTEESGIALARRVMSGVPPQTYRKAVHLLTTFDQRARLAGIKVPTLLIAGSDDRVAPADVMERMAARIPGAEFVRLEGCGHLGPMDQPLPFNEALAAFLARHNL